MAAKRTFHRKAKHVGGAAKVFLVGARHACFSKDHHEPLAIVVNLKITPNRWSRIEAA